MSRSAQVAWAAVALLLAGLAGTALARWEALAAWPPAARVAVLAAGVLGASLAALSIRRIVEPRLPTPVAVTVTAILVGLALVVLWVVVAVRRAARTDARTDDGTRRSLFARDEPAGRGGDRSPGMGLPWAIVATLLALGLYAGAIALFHVPLHPPAGVATASAATPEAPPSAPVASVPPAAPGRLAAPDLAAAIAQVRPRLSDAPDGGADGIAALAAYVAADVSWTALALATDTSARALAAAALGTSACVSGRVVRVEVVAGEPARHAGRLAIAGGSAVELIAVGGAPRRRTTARFCGVVAGRSARGGAPAPLLVGRFAPR